MSVSDVVQRKVLFSGMQPTGSLTFGHVSGALRNWVRMQDEFDALFCVVDMHAITVRQKPAELRRRTLDVAAMYIAGGVDPDKSTVFVQSHVAEHAQLMWVLTCLTGFGECSRMTQFKEKSDRYVDNVNVGLFAYPVLMAADILLYGSHVVPVGNDQKQHLELARNLADRFNHHYSDTFVVPEPVIPDVGGRIMSLQDPMRKMSKSDPNEKATLFLTDSDDAIRSKIRRAVTDSNTMVRLSPESAPGVSNLITLHSIATGRSVKDIEAEFSNITGYSEFKEAVAEAVASYIRPIRERFLMVRKDEQLLASVLSAGAERASSRARKLLRKVFKKTGFVQL